MKSTLRQHPTVTGVIAIFLALSAVLAVLRWAVDAPAHAQEPTVLQAQRVEDVKFSKPGNNTWYQCASLSVPAGTWRLSYRVVAYSSRPKADTGTVSAITTLSASPTSATDRRLTSIARVGGNSYRLIATESGSATATLEQPTTFYLLIQESEGNNWDSLQCLGGAWSPTTITAERA